MYCVACESVYSASNIALVNNANVLALGARILGVENACAMARAFLESEFAGGFAPERRARVEALYRDMTNLENETLQ
jgi:ribose 5-phosphate isomerase B